MLDHVNQLSVFTLKHTSQVVRSKCVIADLTTYVATMKVC